MVTWALPADANVLAGRQTCGDRLRDQRLHGRVAFVEVLREEFHARVAVEAERQLRQVVRADRHAIEVLEKLLGEDCVARHLAHHDHAQAVGAALRCALQPAIGQHADHCLGLRQGAHERHHDLDIGQPHLDAHALQCLALHREGLAEGFAHVARGAAEAEHRVLFFRLVARAADQLAVLVALEVAQANDHRLRPEGGSDRRDAFDQFVDIERTRRRVAARHALDRLLQVAVDVRVVEDRLRVHADVVVDDEFEPCQTDAAVGHLCEVERELRVADVHHDLHRAVGQRAALHVGDLGFQQAVVDVAGVALRAGHGDQRAFFQRLGRIAAADDCRNAQLARNDRRVAGAPAPVGDDRRGALHHRLPVRVGHVGDEHVAGLDLVHVLDAVHDAHRARADLLADRAAFGEHRAAALELVALLDLIALLALHRFGPGLQDVELAVAAVLAPLDVHRAAVVLLDRERVAGEFGYICVAQRIAVAVLVQRVDGLDQLPAPGFFLWRRKLHLDQLRAEVATDDCAFARAQRWLVHVELVGVHGALHHRLAEAVARRDEHHVGKAAFGVDREHHAGRAEVGAHHALHPGRERHVGMRVTLVHAVADGAVVVEAGENLLHLRQHVGDADDVQEGFLLARERGIGHVLCRSR